LSFSTIHSSYSRARLLLLVSDSVAIDGGLSEAAAAAAVQVGGFKFSTQPSASVETR
jgi:hypothetical protein